MLWIKLVAMKDHPVQIKNIKNIQKLSTKLRPSPHDFPRQANQPEAYVGAGRQSQSLNRPKSLGIPKSYQYIRLSKMASTWCKNPELSSLLLPWSPSASRKCAVHPASSEFEQSSLLTTSTPRTHRSPLEQHPQPGTPHGVPRSSADEGSPAIYHQISRESVQESESKSCLFCG